MNQDDQKWFEKALSKDWTSEEQKYFEARLKEDLSFKSDFELFQSMNSYLDSTNENKNALDVLNEAKHEQRGKAVSTVQAPNSALRILIMMLMLSLIFLLGLKIFKNASADKLEFAEMYLEPAWPLERGDNKTPVQESLAKYFEGQSNKAKMQLKTLGDIEAKYWLSEIYFKENKPDSMLLYLPENDVLSSRKDRVDYLRIFALLTSNQRDRAKRIYEALPSNYPETYKDLLTKAFDE